MMALNEDILDAIRNRRYSLRQTPQKAPTTPGQDADADDAGTNEDNHIIARILHRRLQMEYDQSEEEEDDDDDDVNSDFESIKSFNLGGKRGGKKQGGTTDSETAERTVKSM